MTFLHPELISKMLTSELVAQRGRRGIALAGECTLAESGGRLMGEVKRL